jgi:hypothetical protein
MSYRNDGYIYASTSLASRLFSMRDEGTLHDDLENGTRMLDLADLGPGAVRTALPAAEVYSYTATLSAVDAKALLEVRPQLSHRGYI